MAEQAKQVVIKRDYLDAEHGEQIIHRGRDLRIVVDHVRRVGLDNAWALKNADGSGTLALTFGDASYCETDFADYTVLVAWLRARRSWRGCCQCATGERF
jgi:hypothetical protein